MKVSRYRAGVEYHHPIGHVSYFGALGFRKWLINNMNESSKEDAASVVNGEGDDSNKVTESGGTRRIKWSVELVLEFMITERDRALVSRCER